jgi:catechol 2,3-dioxygenase-like lactoylglutathione lyase family enzyme
MVDGWMLNQVQHDASMSEHMTHGQILCGTATVPDLDAGLADYRDALGLSVVESGTLAADLAASWGCPASTGARYAVLQPASGARAFVRLVEQPVPAAFVPTRTYGWAAFEITVQDVFGWPARLAGSGFDIVGLPKEIPGLPYFVAMQMTGRGREMIYLNEVRSNTPTSDLPPAQSPIDRMFIVILACADRPAALDWYANKLHLDIGADYTIPYTMIQKAFGLPDDHLSTITMMQKGRMPIVEVDGYPDAATARGGNPDRLPAGNAMVTLAVDNLDALDLDWIVPPKAREGALYAGKRTATVRGPAGELIELIETSKQT